LKCVNCGHSKC